MKNSVWLAAFAIVIAIAAVASAQGEPSLKKLVRKEVAKQIAKAEGPPGQQGVQGVQGPAGATGAVGPTVGRSAHAIAPCNPDGTFIDCISVNVTLPEAGRVLVNADGEGWAVGAVNADGVCQLAVDSAPLAPPFTGRVVQVRPPPDQVPFSLTGVSGVLAAGQHTLRLQCRETLGTFRVQSHEISAVGLGSG